jgi:hypothetical protein
VLADTITRPPPGARGSAIVASSHGGTYAGGLALAAGCRGAIFNDAGFGKDRAGAGSLALFDALGVPCALVSHASCRIGEAADMWARGIVSAANAAAARLGIAPGQGCAQAARAMAAAPMPSYAPPPPGAENRVVLREPGWTRAIVLIDSASLVEPGDAGAIVVTGSHGALIGGNPAKALQVDGFAGVYNDAGFGADGCGTTRLPALDARGIAGLAVAADSARIGDARSTFEDGVISAVNARAAALGAAAGQKLRPLLGRWAGAGRGGGGGCARPPARPSVQADFRLVAAGLPRCSATS